MIIDNYYEFIVTLNSSILKSILIELTFSHLLYDDYKTKWMIIVILDIVSYNYIIIVLIISYKNSCTPNTELIIIKQAI